MTLFFSADDAGADEGAIEPGRNEDFSHKPEPPDPGDPHSNLLSTLRVTADSCYVFLQPKHSSQYFGPLVKEEKLKWLDTQGDWIRAWIPRLRISGWVHRKTVQETTEETSSPVKIPEHLLSNVTVITERANIRQAPTTRSKILSVAREDQEFWLLNRSKNWYQIWLSGLEKKGWIYSTLVSKKHKNSKPR